MNIIPIDPKHKKEEERKKQLLEVVDELKKQIEEGKILEFAACSVDVDGDCQIHVSCSDIVSGIGMFEIGKHLLVQSEQML